MLKWQRAPRGTAHAFFGTSPKSMCQGYTWHDGIRCTTNRTMRCKSCVQALVKYKARLGKAYSRKDLVALSISKEFS